MSFRVIAHDGGEEMVSSVLTTKEQALGFAKDLRREGLKILRIVTGAGDIVVRTDEVVEWHRTSSLFRDQADVHDNQKTCLKTRV